MLENGRTCLCRKELRLLQAGSSPRNANRFASKLAIAPLSPQGACLALKDLEYRRRSNTKNTVIPTKGGLPEVNKLANI